MTILVDTQIRTAIAKGTIKVTPFDVNLINPNSLDIRLGNKFGYPVAQKLWNGVYLTDPLDKDSFKTYMQEWNHYILRPGEFVLAHLLEDIVLSDSICAEIRGKSSLGRLGVDNSSVAGFVDAGWSGVLTIELANHGRYPMLLTPGMKIGQMIFHQCAAAEKPYGVTGRYQNQTPGQGSKGI